ncbi:hypothetical protein [Streptomyces sviceus]
MPRVYSWRWGFDFGAAPIDPPAFDGYDGFIWAEFLDRWLW